MARPSRVRTVSKSAASVASSSSPTATAASSASSVTSPSDHRRGCGPKTHKAPLVRPVGVDQWHPEVRAETAGRRRHHRCHPPVAGRVVDDERTTGAGGECAQQLRQVATGTGPLGDHWGGRSATSPDPTAPRGSAPRAPPGGPAPGCRPARAGGGRSRRRVPSRTRRGCRSSQTLLRTVADRWSTAPGAGPGPLRRPSVTYRRVCVSRTSGRAREWGVLAAPTGLIGPCSRHGRRAATGSAAPRGCTGRGDPGRPRDDCIACGRVRPRAGAGGPGAGRSLLAGGRGAPAGRALRGYR